MELEGFKDMALIMELILVCQKHLEKSQLVLCKAITKCDLEKSSLPGLLPTQGMGETTSVFAWFLQCCCRKAKHLPSALMPRVMHGNMYLQVHAMKTTHQ